MAGGQAVELYGYRFTAKPQSRWRRFTFDFLPYWQSSKPRFILNVTNIKGSPTQENKEIRWFIKFATGDTTDGVANIPPLQEDSSATLIVGDKLLGFTGDTLLILPVELLDGKPREYETVYAFHTTHKSWVFLAVVAGILAGAFSVLGQWLFGS